MPITKPNDFWKLILESGLMTRETLRPLHDAYKKVTSNGDARGLATWLVKGGHLTAYQARVLLAGRPKAIAIGDYQIFDRLEQEPLKGVLAAIHKPTGHPVWLHPIAAEVQQDPVRWPIVQRMCQLRSAGPHPHLVRCFELRQGSKRSYLVTEQLEGNPLGESRPGEGIPIPTADCARLSRQATLGAGHIHVQGMVIGDFTMNHLWLESNGNLKLLHLPTRPVEAIDWANQENAAQLDPLANVAAPELQQPGSAPTRLSDIYAIGALLFDLLTGKPLFEGSIRDRLQQHASAPVPQPPFIPGSLMQVVQYLLSKSPGGRYQTTQDVAEALRPFVDQAQLSPPVSEIPPTLGPYLQHLASQGTPAATSPAPVPPGVPPAAVPFPGGPPQPAVPPTAAPFPVAAPVPPAAVPQPIPAQPAMAQPVVAQPVVAQPAVATAVPAALPVGEGAPSRASAMTERIRKRKLQRKITSIVVLGVMAIAALVGGIYGYQVVFPGRDIAQDESVEVESDPATTGPIDQSPEVKPELPSPSGPRLVEDDGETLWASPTDGEPIDLAGLPNDTRLALVVRMAELLGSPEGDRIVRALGPNFASVRQQVENDLGVKFDALETFTLGQGASTANGPPVLILELRSPTNLLSLWGNPSPLPGTAAPMYQVQGWTVMPLSGRPDQAFLAGPRAAIEQVAGGNLGAPQLTRELEQLRRESDASRMVNLLFEPQFLYANPDQALQGNLSAGQDTVRDFLGDSLRGVLLSGHLADHLFLEMRCEGSISQTPPMVAQTLKEKVLGISRRLEDTIPELNAVPYWRRLALQFPNMVRYAYQHARAGAEGNQALVNVVLPASAGQNLVAGTELMLAASAAPPAAAGPAMVAATSEPKTIEEKLKVPASISFPQNSLEFALRDIGELAGIEVEIRGPDLQLDGITRNKEIKDFHHENKPVGEILANLLVRANPEASEGPGTEVQKLIYVILPQDGPEEEKKIVVTTRAAAARDKHELPEAFQIK